MDKPLTMNACKRYVASTVDYDEVYKYHMMGLSAKQIAAKMGRDNPAPIANAIKNMRNAYGEEVVPYIRDTRRTSKPEPESKPKPKPKPKAERKPKPESKPKPKKAKEPPKPTGYAHVGGDGIPPTWAGAFRELMVYCGARGYQDAYDYAKHIAKEKGMRL